MGILPELLLWTLVRTFQRTPFPEPNAINMDKLVARWSSLPHSVSTSPDTLDDTCRVLPFKMSQLLGKQGFNSLLSRHIAVKYSRTGSGRLSSTTLHLEAGDIHIVP